MTRLNETTVNSNSGTVDVGAGLNWDPVYQALEPTGVNVVGGQVPGVGVAGTTLGGGGCPPSLGSWISYGFRLFIIVEPVWTDG
jgi:FAD/FMN-containing dehydrogenase